MKLKFTFFTLWITIAGSLYGQVADREELHFTILHTNDEHSHLIPIPAVDDHPVEVNSAQGGISRLAGAIREIRRQKSETGEPVLLLSAGDILGGPVFGWLPLRPGLAPELNLMQKMGYDAVAIGNHEFDYGADLYARYLADAGYPGSNEQTILLGTNTRPPNDHPLSERGIRDYHIKELKNGLRIGLFGLIGNDAISKTAQPGPVQFDDPVEAAGRAVSYLNDAGVDIIIAVTHSGVKEDRRLARSVPGIDLIVGGHTHTPLYEPVTEGETIIVQAGKYMQHLGVLELSRESGTGKISIRNRQNGRPFLNPIDDQTPVDREIAADVENYRQVLNEWLEELTDGVVTDLRQTIAVSNFPILNNEPQRESAIGNFVTDAMKFSADRVLEHPVDIAVQANGAIRSDVEPGTEEWNEGEISFYDMMMAFGLGSGRDGSPGYPMVSFYLTENEVRNALEVSVLLSELMGDNYFLQLSGVNMSYNPSRAVLFKVPFTDTPIPTSRAVLQAELIRENEQPHRLHKGEEKLIHVVTDYYIAGFLPMVGDVLPNLTIQLRDKNGEPTELDNTIIMDGGSQLKVWQAVLNYTQSFDAGEAGFPLIPEIYSAPEGRQVVIFTLPLWVWPVAALLLIGLAVFVVARRR